MVSDICVIMTNRGDQAPHSYCTIDRNLNKGTMVGSDIYVCYKKSMNRSNYIAYTAGVLDHFPFNHRPGFPIPTDLALFCLPMGATLESWPAQAVKPQPVFSTFVLTVTAGEGNTEAVEKVYGAAVTFYEKFPHNHLTQEQREILKLNEHFGRHNIVHTNKCICILSRWPFFDTFDRFLKYLHNMANSGPHAVPLERYIYHFLECVPFPSARRPRILIQLDAKERISLAQPEDSPISLSGAKFRQLVMNLRPEGCLTVLMFALTEQKILLHSLRPDVLTAVAEAISMIIFPFHWQCPYIPLCPLGLSDFLNAPIPFLLGLDSRFFDLYDPPTDVICIDLDTGAMSVPDDKKYLTTKILPSRATRTLRASLECLCEKILKFEKSFQQHLKSQKTEPDGSIDSDFKMKRKEQQLDVEIQEAFLRFTATILKGYSAYLLPIVSAKAGAAACDTSSLFDLDAFVKSRDKKYHRFYQLLVNTQMFSKFIEERSFVSDKDASLAFFDDCAEKVIDEDASIRLLEVEMAQSEHTLFLPPPEPVYLPEGLTYSYSAFPKLKPELFPLCEPKPVLPPKMKAPQTTPASPLARRTKQEVKTDQRLASRYSQTPILWAKCLLSTCYSLWFTHLPAFASTQHHKARFLQLAFKILTNMQKLHLSQADEVSYRVMMQLCGLYSQPILAVKVLCEMRQHGITPNAITYGYYNRAVMENKWTHSNLFWNKLRNVVIGVSAFKRSGMERAQRRKSSLSLDVVDKCLTDADSASRVSLESGTSLDSHPPAPHAKTDTLSSDPGYCSVSETSESVSSPGAPPTAVPVTRDPASWSTTSDTNDLSGSFPISLPNDACIVAYSLASSSSISNIDSVSRISSTSFALSSAAQKSSILPFVTSLSVSQPSIITTTALSLSHITSTSASSLPNSVSVSSSVTSCVVPLSSYPVNTSSTTSTMITTTPCTSISSSIPSITDSLNTAVTPSTISIRTPSFSSCSSASSSSSSLTTIAPLSGIITSDPSSSSPIPSLPLIIPSPASVNLVSSSSVLTAMIPSSSSASTSSFSSPYVTSRALDFSESDALRARLGSIVRSSAASLASGANLLLIEYNVAFSSSAGLLMTSALDSSVFDTTSRTRERPTDLADALSPTLDQYDKMSEATVVRTSPETPVSAAQEKVVPEYLRCDSYGSDAKIITNLLRLAKVEIEPLTQVHQFHASSNPLHSENSTSFTSVDQDSSPHDDVRGIDSLSRSNESLSDISEEETGPRSGLLQGFFSRNAPERLSSLFKRSVDSADEKIRGFWKRSASVSRSSSKDSVSLEQGITDYMNDSREGSASKICESKSSVDRKSEEKTPEVPGVSDFGDMKDKNSSLSDKQPQTLLLPPQSPSITINRPSSYSPIPSSPKRTPVTGNDPLGAFSLSQASDEHRLMSWGAPPSHGSVPASQLSESVFSAHDSPSRQSTTSDDSEMSSLTFGQSVHAHRSSRRVARSATFTSRSDQDTVRHHGVQRSANSLWTLSPSPSPTHTSNSSHSNHVHSSERAASDDPVHSALVASTPTWPSLKLTFSNSSSRLGLASNMASVGLRQATKQIEQLRSQYIDPAMADLGQYSPGNFNYRKNELISGGLSSMKSAVTSLSKKYNEIREAISATNTPVRGAVHSTSISLPTTSFLDYYFRTRTGDGDGDEDSLDGFWSRRESADVQGVAPLEDPGAIIFGGIGASAGSEGEAIATQQDLFPPLGWDPTGPFCLGLWLTSCTRCHNCAALLYDEEIMAGWRPDDSNLNTKCTFCEKMTVPLLTITVYDLRQEPRPAKETEDPSESDKPTPAPTGGIIDATDRGLLPEEAAKDDGKVDQNLKDYVGSQLQKKGVRCEPITVPYLSPLVLRKELETVLGHEGDTCLTDTAFTDHHPILYWNLLWYFCRLRVPSHIPGLCLSAVTVARDRIPHASWEGADWQNVYVRCLWDNAKYHEELGQPMYIQWQQEKQPSPLVSALIRERTKVSRDVMQSVITALHMDDLTTAMKLVLQELRKRPSSLKKNHFPIYRDLLFFASSCIPPAQLNLIATRTDDRALEGEFKTWFLARFLLLGSITRRKDFQPTALTPQSHLPRQAGNM
ncbi:DENN domain-containing protein Crag isoform X1 [Panulirus ornatus]|uniref:DENN domain-containing protein Crag isoform X1 n=1 Tax=Panulirus ornatus TaxID=150431 RepID=UPI003A87EED4